MTQPKRSADEAQAGPDFTSIRWLEDLGSSDTGTVGGKNASLGESVVQGKVNPDHYVVFKPLLGKRAHEQGHRRRLYRIMAVDRGPVIDNRHGGSLRGRYDLPWTSFGIP